MPAIFTPETLNSHLAHLQKEKEAARIQAWVEEQEAHEIDPLNHSDTPANAARQIGRMMTVADLERKLHKLAPSLVFRVNPFNTTKKAMYLGTDLDNCLLSYENSTMPEFSLRKIMYEDIRDYAQTVIDRRDLPASTYYRDPDLGPDDPGKLEFDDPDAIKPGYRRVYRVGGELVRGWWTILIRLVGLHILTPTQVEREFGYSTRAEWAAASGKSAILQWS